jgi:polyhydroxyalkanoate synthase
MALACLDHHPDPVPPTGRRGPRPLALHLGLARLARDAAEPQAVDPLQAFVRGLRAYWRHPYRRKAAGAPAIWRLGAVRLLDYGPESGLPLLAVPSLVNRAYILDLAPEFSLLGWLAGRGVRPLLLDWGDPGPEERRFTLSGYVAERLEPALDAVLSAVGRPPVVLGYCMGGLLALALAVRRPGAIAGLALLATPWDFHAGGLDPKRFERLARSALASADALGALPVELIQALFAGIDPLQVPRKLARFAELEPASSEAAAFVAVEDWLNDGVPLAAEVAHECLLGWYVENRPARGSWRIAGTPVWPDALNLPSLVAIPARDRIVPPESAAALAGALRDPTVLRLAGGHIGMLVGTGARHGLRAPLAVWLRQIAAMRK